MKWVRGYRKRGFWHLVTRIEHMADHKGDPLTYIRPGCGAGGYFDKWVDVVDDAIDGHPEGKVCARCKEIAHLVRTGEALEITIQD